MCGAIPVVVGSSREVAATFFDWPGLPPPPWLFFHSWAEAAAGMAALAADAERLDARQREVQQWWSFAVSFWRAEIAGALDRPRDSHSRARPEATYPRTGLSRGPAHSGGGRDE